MTVGTLVTSSGYAARRTRPAPLDPSRFAQIVPSPRQLLDRSLAAAVERAPRAMGAVATTRGRLLDLVDRSPRGELATTGADPTDASIVVAPADDPVLSVVVVTYGHGDVVIDALTRLADDLARSSIGAEVVVVDQPHPTRAHRTARLLARQSAGLGVVRAAENLGFAGGNNLGVAFTSAPTLMFMNPDVLVGPGQVAALVDRAAKHPDAILAPRLVNLDGSTQERGWRVIHDGHTRPVLDGDHVEADYASAACWLMSRELFDRVGGFDTGYHPAYYEDVDFAVRARSVGAPTIIADDLAVTHRWSVNDRGGPPEVSAQRRRFVERWPDLVAERATE